MTKEQLQGEIDRLKVIIASREKFNENDQRAIEEYQKKINALPVTSVELTYNELYVLVNVMSSSSTIPKAAGELFTNTFMTIFESVRGELATKLYSHLKVEDAKR